MTIFENLVYNENTFTELFRNIMRFKIFRREFLSLIDYDFSCEDLDFESFSTQKTTQNVRPDLVISTPTLDIFVEIKVWNTALTVNQPNGYLKALEESNKDNKILVLLTPKNYKHLSNYNDILLKTKSNIKTQTIFWSDIIEKIDQEEIFQGNSLLSEYRELLREWFEPKQIEINNKFLEIMNSPDTPNSLEKLTDLINQIKTELQKSGVEITRNRTNILNEYGFYSDTGDSYSLYVGEWFYYWKETGNPFCIAIKTDNEELLKDFQEMCKSQNLEEPKIFGDRNWLTYNIKLNNINDNVVETLTNIIKIIIKIVKKYDPTTKSTGHLEESVNL